MKKFWLVWRERASSDSGELSSFLPQYKHDTEESARTEAERLARRYGGKFHVLELAATVERDDMKWSDQEKPRTLHIEVGSMTIETVPWDCESCRDTPMPRRSGAPEGEISGTIRTR